MCKQVIERYNICKCVYHIHAVDPCPAVTRKDHKVQRREVYVGTSCSQHPKAKESEDRPGILIRTKGIASDVKSRFSNPKYHRSGPPKRFASSATRSEDARPADEAPGNQDRPTDISTHEKHRSQKFIDANTDCHANSTLREKILEKVVNPNNTTERFVPIGDLHSVLTGSAVKDELQRNEISEIFSEVFDHTKKIFVILLMIERLDILSRMVKAGLSDNHLPFTMYDYQEKDSRFSYFPSKSVEWDVKAQERFMSTQWMFLAPVFEVGEHKVLEDSTRLPFTNIEPLGIGSFGKIHRVRIHADHYRFDSAEAEDARKDHVFAVKEFTQDTKEANSRIFKNEKAILSSMRSSDVDRVIRILASFEHRGNYYMILPLAKGNLRQFWARSQPWRSSWCLEEMAGISAGLSALHFAAGWHSDLRPENILIFEDGFSGRGSWKISDFGLSHLHSQGAKSELPPYPGTGTYEPPECQLELKQSQKYDLWSLGCIFLECVTWLLKGSEAIERFADDRVKDTPASDENFKNDYFFSLNANQSFPTLGARIRPAVLMWIDTLDKSPNCSPEISQTLQLIRDSLLQIEQTMRMEASEVSRTLCNLARHSTDDSLLSSSQLSQESLESRVTELNESDVPNTSA